QAARTRADEAKTALLGAPDFAAAAKRAGLEAREITFGRGDALGEAGRDPQLDEAVFGLAVGGVSVPIKTAAGYAVIKGAQQIPAGVPPVAEIRDRLLEAIKRERAEQQLSDKAKTLAAAVTKGGDFATAAKAEGFTTGSIPLFSRADPPKERGSIPGSVLLAALQTPAGQVAEPVRAEGGVYVVKTLERQPASPDGFNRERDELDKQVLEQKRALAWDTWIRGRLASAKGEVGGQPASMTRWPAGGSRWTRPRSSSSTPSRSTSPRSARWSCPMAPRRWTASRTPCAGRARAASLSFTSSTRAAGREPRPSCQAAPRSPSTTR